MTMRNLPSLIAGLALLTAGTVLAGEPLNPQDDTRPNQQAAPQVIDAAVQRDFAKLDVDQNGSLSQDEANADLTLRNEFTEFDANADQWLSKVEYRDFRMTRLDPAMDDEEEAE